MQKAKLKSFLIVTLSLVIVGVLGFVDYFTNPILTFYAFYLIPIFLVLWFVGSRMSILMLIATIIVWVFDDILPPRSIEHPFIPYWNVFIKVVLFVTYIYILSSLKRILDREKMFSRIDHLTEIANKRYFYETAYKEISRVNRYRRPITLAYIDLDGFKQINDSLGHAAGDRFLRLTAQTLKKGVRMGDAVARMGGDEFAILFPETNYEGAKIAIQRLQKEISNVTENNTLPTTLSIGVVTCDTPPCALDSLIDKADSLMYLAKKEGRNIVKHEVYQ